ncbi:hypothetical protein DEF95_011690 [Xanthomonas vasicola]|nr:hypothetical protein DEF95_011690 [Xanthomonas vasicola]
MDAAKFTRTSLQRVPRWWTGKGPATKPQIYPGRWAAYPLAKRPTRAALHLSHHDLRRHLSQTADQSIAM